MKNQVTWSQLIIVAIILFAIYYVWVAVLPSKGKPAVIYNTDTNNVIQGTKN